LFFGISNRQSGFARSAAVFDRIQLIGFCIQKLIIYSLYIYCILFLFQISSAVSKSGRYKVFIYTICINIFVVFINILFIVTEFKFYYIQISFKTVVYSIKLKLEFSVLNRFSLYFFTPVFFQIPEPK